MHYYFFGGLSLRIGRRQQEIRKLLDIIAKLYRYPAATRPMSFPTSRS